LFDGKNVFIGGKIHITDLQKTVETLMMQMPFYSETYEEIKNIS
jgi:hypothetical protein